MRPVFVPRSLGCRARAPGKGVSRAQFLCSAEHPKDLMSDLTEKHPGVQCLWSLSSDPLPRAVGF